MTGSSVDEPVFSDDDKVESSVGKPAENQGSVVKPAQDPGDLVVAWYNITWPVGKVEGKGHAGHERKLEADLKYAFTVLEADIVLLSECGEIEIGLPQKKWAAIMNRICGDAFEWVHQSHYTSIVRRATVRVLDGPRLRGPLTQLEGHGYRQCQYLKWSPS